MEGEGAALFVDVALGAADVDGVGDGLALVVGAVTGLACPGVDGQSGVVAVERVVGETADHRAGGAWRAGPEPVLVILQPLNGETLAWPDLFAHLPLLFDF